MKIEILKLSDEQINELGIKHWPIWEKGISKFDWEYDTQEQCLFLEGHVIVTPENGEEVEIKNGDFATFPEGMKCVWEVLEPVRKHYKFG